MKIAGRIIKLSIIKESVVLGYCVMCDRKVYDTSQTYHKVNNGYWCSECYKYKKGEVD